MANIIKIIAISVLSISMLLIAACTKEETEVATKTVEKLTNKTQQTESPESEKMDLVNTNIDMDEVETEEIINTPGEYKDYFASAIEESNGETVLFFHANWCPTCRSADSEFNENEIPAGVTLLKVDYDEADDMKEKYEITSQHTFVQVDSEGNMINKWTGGGVEELTINLLS